MCTYIFIITYTFITCICFLNRQYYHMHILSNSFEFFVWFTKVDDLEHSFDVINSKPKPLAAYLFTKDHKLEKKFVKTVSAGGMLINDAILQVTFPSKIAEVTSLEYLLQFKFCASICMCESLILSTQVPISCILYLTLPKLHRCNIRCEVNYSNILLKNCH